MCHDVRPCGHFGSSRWCPPCQRLRKQGMRPRAARRATMPAGRTCVGAGCQTRLSVYNSGDLCSVCMRRNERGPSIASTPSR